MTVDIDLTGESITSTIAGQNAEAILQVPPVEDPELSISVDEDHILDLAHVFLWLQAGDVGPILRKCSLKIKQSAENDKYRVRAFLASKALHDRVTNQDVFLPSEKDTGGIVSGRRRRFGAILPLLEINATSYRILARPVNKVLQLDKGVPFRDLGDAGIFARKGGFRNDETARIIGRACADYAEEGVLKDHLSEWSVRLQIADMSMFSFLLLCALCHELSAGGRGKVDLGYDDVGLLQVEALDAAEALLQLAENVILHTGAGPISDNPASGGEGYMALRIHRWDKFDRLRRLYPRYLEGHDNRFGGEDESDWAWYKRVTESPKLRTEREAQLAPQELEEARHVRMRRISDRQSFRGGRVDNDTASRNAVAYIEARIMDRGQRGMVNTFSDTFSDSGVERVAGFFDPNLEERTFWAEWAKETRNLVHHYGLTLVDSLVKGLDGCLIVRSGLGTDDKVLYSSSGDVMASVAPGTYVAVLIPARLGALPAVGLSDTGPVVWDLETEWKIQEVDRVAADFGRTLRKGVRAVEESLWQKEGHVSSIAHSLSNYTPTEATITVFNAPTLGGLVPIELFAKGVASWIVSLSEVPDKDTHPSIAIANCDRWQFMALVRMFTAFYDRAENNILLGNTQLYIVGKEAQDEFWLGGGNLSVAVATQLRLNASRGVGGASMAGLTSQLTQTLAQRISTSPADAVIPKLVPFDLFVPIAGGKFPFARNTLSILVGSMRNPRSGGLKISNVHVGLGSKVHADAFYEAHILFRSPHYVDRYAWLVSDVLLQEGITADKPVLIVGYETYSTAIVDKLAEYGESGKWKTALYASESLVPDRGGRTYQVQWDSPPTEKKMNLVMVVPVATTMATFRKIEADVRREMECRVLSIGKTIRITLCHVSDKPTHLVKSLFVSDSVVQESVVKGRVVYSKVVVQSKEREEGKDGKTTDSTFDVLKIHTVRSSWHDPLTCDQCYPDVLTHERPLESTAGSPVVLDLVYGSAA